MVKRENLIEFLVDLNKIDSSAVLKKKKIEKDTTRLLLCLTTGSISNEPSSDYSFLTPWTSLNISESELKFTDVVWENWEQ